MTPYGPVSLALLHDLRVRPLTWAERGVLHHLSLLAGVSADGVTVRVARRAGEAEVAAWTAALGVDGAAIVGRLVELGLLVTCPEGLQVVLVARAPQASPAASQSAPQRHAQDWQGKPSSSPTAQRARNDRAAFRARSKGWARIPDGVTWEQWVATDEGQRFIASRDGGFDGYRQWVTPRGNTANTPGVTPPVTPLGNTPGNVSLNPSSLGEEKKEEGERVTGNTPRVTPQGNTPGVTPLDALREAAAGKATLTGASALEVEFNAVLARHGLTADELTRAGRAFEQPDRWWPKGKNPAPRHVTLNDLAGFRGDAGFEWRALAALVAHVRASKPAAARARSAAPAPPPPPPSARATEEMARSAARSLAAASPSPATALVTSQETADA